MRMQRKIFAIVTLVLLLIIIFLPHPISARKVLDEESRIGTYKEYSFKTWIFNRIYIRIDSNENMDIYIFKEDEYYNFINRALFKPEKSFNDISSIKTYVDLPKGRSYIVVVNDNEFFPLDRLDYKIKLTQYGEKDAFWIFIIFHSAVIILIIFLVIRKRRKKGYKGIAIASEPELLSLRCLDGETFQEIDEGLQL
ncbi:MAG: hypothetical protein ACMUHM_00775 [Thermoplasmatota archaeon]